MPGIKDDKISMIAEKNSKIMLTGVPGSGKSTLVKKIIASLNKPAVGFFREEIR